MLAIAPFAIAQHKDKGITLSTVGFGSGNYKDVMMEQLATEKTR